MNEKKIFSVPAGERTIGVMRYARDPELTEVTIPEGVEVIGAKAFSQCVNLRTLRLPRSLTNIDMKSFELCPLEDIFYGGSAAQWAQVEISPQGSQAITAAKKHFAAQSSPEDVPDPPAEDHRQEIFCRVRRLLSQGGDGRLHIVAPDLCMDGVLTKPGDLTLIIFPKGTTMLIDTGYFANLPKVTEFLREIDLTRVDHMAFSHADGDHVSNAQAIADIIYSKEKGEIRHFWWTGQQFGAVVPGFVDFLRSKGTQIDLTVRAGRSFQIDGVRVDILGPTEEEMRWDPSDGEIRNSQSMIMKFTYGAATYLTCGDLYENQEAAVVSRCGRALRADISKTNHHGCFTSNSKPWLDAVGGKIAFSCSNDNGSTDLAREMESRNVDYYATGCHGTILVSASLAGEYHVSTQYDRGMRCSHRVN